MPPTDPAPKSWVCFRTCGASDAAIPPMAIHLKAPQAEALAELVPVLMCGEESAALTFDRLARTATSELYRAALLRIAQDENRHEMLLRSLRAALPVPKDVSVGKLRHFFKAAAARDIGTHFTRIAALDSALCCVLATMRTRSSPIAADEALGTMFRDIHRDEARHVKLSLRFSRALANAPQRQRTAAEMRQRFVRLLAFHADAFDRLEIDPDRMFARLLNIPGFLVQ